MAVKEGQYGWSATDDRPSRPEQTPEERAVEKRAREITGTVLATRLNVSLAELDQALAQKLLPAPIGTRMRSMESLSGYDRIFDVSQIREHLSNQRQLSTKVLAAQI